MLVRNITLRLCRWLTALHITLLFTSLSLLLQITFITISHVFLHLISFLGLENDFFFFDNCVVVRACEIKIHQQISGKSHFQPDLILALGQSWNTTNSRVKTKLFYLCHLFSFMKACDTADIFKCFLVYSDYL